MEKKSQTTMKDIAKELGVSVATVSRALNDSPTISKAQRERIQKYANEHNFIANDIAKDLRNSHRHPIKIIGVIIPEMIHYYFASILSGIEQTAYKRGYRVMVAQSNEEYEREVEICWSFVQIRTCGVILSQAKTTTNYDHFKKMQELGIPLIFYDRICTGINASRVVVDDYNAAFTATQHLIETGCKRIAFYCSNMKLEISKNRYNGYRDALLKHHIPFDDSLVIYCDNREDAERITPDILSRDNRPDGIFAINDDTAIGILYVAKNMGLKVPEDLSICGFTNDHRAVSCDPMLTTIDQRGKKVGEEAANILIDMAEGLTPKDQIVKRIVKTELVKRETTR
ncbi:MAG: LacI family transcriptional regulator [Prevotella sp.]|nr:LacI family transcriptional regulator [Prevotella sp.]